jgi:hypothetical protein
LLASPGEDTSPSPGLRDDDPARFRLALGTPSDNLAQGAGLPVAAGQLPSYETAWQISPSASFTSRQKVARNTADDGTIGLTKTETVHNLIWKLGAGQLAATLTDANQEWSPVMGKPNARQRKTVLEFKSDFGSRPGNGVRFALTTSDSTNGPGGQSGSMKEAHVKLAPSGRLQLNADYVLNSAAGGKDRATRTFGAIFQLAPDSKLLATMEALSEGGGARTRTKSLKLDTKLGGGASTAKLLAERRLVATDNGKEATATDVVFTGGIGSGNTRTEVRVGQKQQREEGITGCLSRMTTFHAERAFGKGITFTADHATSVMGSLDKLMSWSRYSYLAAADLGSRTHLEADLGSQNQVMGQLQQTRGLSVKHHLGKVVLEADHLLWRDNSGAGRTDRFGLDLPTRELPAWAKSISHDHAFSDASEFLIPKDPSWLDMPFAGWRLWTKVRQGGEDGGVHTLALAHRTMLGKRLHFQFAYERNPESDSGVEQGRPARLERRLCEVASPVGKSLAARVRVGVEENPKDTLSFRHTLDVSLWGRKSEKEQLEASYSRTAGLWAAQYAERNSVSLLYSRKVTEERQWLLKVGYAWGSAMSTSSDSGSSEDSQGLGCRVSLRYAKPI